MTVGFGLNDLEATSTGKELNLLLVGRNGHGKSSTGNSILQTKVFPTKGRGDFTTTECGRFGTQLEGRQLNVVDTPGTMDTSNPGDAFHHLATAISFLQGTIDAFILVLNYKTRYTEEEKNVIEKFKQLFQSEVMDFMAVVFTHGDNFKTEMIREEGPEGRTFSDYLKDDGGKYLNDLLSSCDNRYVLFDNYAKGEAAMTQITSLVSMIDGMVTANNGKRYRSNFLDFVPHVSTDAICNEYDDDVATGRDPESSLLTGASGRDQSPLTGTRGRDQSPLTGTPGRDQSPVTRAQGRTQSTFTDAQGRTESIFTGAQGSPPSSPMEVPPLTGRQITMAVVEDDRADDGLKRKIEDNMKSTGHECFPANAKVMMSSGAEVKMEDLEVGDKVLTMSGTGSVYQTEVYMFGHALQDCKATFVCLKTATRLLRVTGGHIIYTSSHGNCVPKAAKDVVLGDVLLTLKDGRYVPEKVTKIWWSEEQGLYAPFTMSGSVIVDGVLASCYVDLLSAEMAHSLMWPVRQMYKMSPTMLRVVNKTGKDGIPQWINWILKALIF